MKHQFISNIQELYDSIIEFNSKPYLWKSVLGGGAKYFVHTIQDGRHLFALSKFCAFKGITVEKYISGYRHNTHGTTTKRHISKVLRKDWVELPRVKKEIRTEFVNWIYDFYPHFNTSNCSIITIPPIIGYDEKEKNPVTPEELNLSLELQRKIGLIGEEIALEFEKERLLKIGVKNPDKYIEHISQSNISAGFDIRSFYSELEERYIEAKSTISKSKTNELFITENEIQTLEDLGEKAFIYLVHITDLEKKIGIVTEYQNPIKRFKESGLLIPIAYKVILN